jgi:hypothetical protein
MNRTTISRCRMKFRSLAAASGLLCSCPGLWAAVDGVVMNATTGKPQPSITVNLIQPSAKGMQSLGSVKTDEQGKFKIDKDWPPGPALVQATYQGATYTLAMTPGSPTSGVQLKIYDSTNKSGTAPVAEDMMLIEPGADAILMSETLLIQNKTNLTYADPAKGSTQFYVPEAAADKIRVTINPPGGMPLQRPAQKTDQAGIYKVNYPLSPGETRIDVDYTLPNGAHTISGKGIHPGSPLRLVTPASVTLSGAGITAIGQEPQSQARIYSVSGPAFEAKVEGTGSLRNPQGDAQEEDTGQPQIAEESARVYSQLAWVLGLTFGILLLGGVWLYRRGAA